MSKKMTPSEFRAFVHDEASIEHPDPIATFARLALELVPLLEASACPVARTDDDCGYERCDWCRDRKRLLAALREAGFVE